MTILITGAAGFIGSNICKQLLRKAGVAVVGVDNFNSYYSSAIKKRRVSELETHKNFIFIRSSFYQTSTLQRVQKKYKPTMLIHTAAEVGVRNGEIHPLAYMETNILGTAALLETIGKTMKHIVLFSSSSVYGNAPLPFNEFINLSPLSTYGISKLGMEQYAQRFYAKTSMPITIVRPFSVYGPDGRPDMLPMKLLSAALHNKSITITGKNAMRDWTYIDDLVAAVTKIAATPKKYTTVNIGFGKPITNHGIAAIAKHIISGFGHTLTYTFAQLNPIETSGTWADISTLKKTYHMQPVVSFEEGFQKTAEYFFSHLSHHDQKA